MRKENSKGCNSLSDSESQEAELVDCWSDNRCSVRRSLAFDSGINFENEIVVAKVQSTSISLSSYNSWRYYRRDQEGVSTLLRSTQGRS